MTRHLLLTLLTILLAVGGVSAQRTRTTRQRLRVDPSRVADRVAADTTAACDTLADADARRAVALNGFGKPLRSGKEALLVTNLLSADSLMVAVTIDIEYVDVNGRQIHRRPVTLTFPDPIPAGETRQATFTSFDTQGRYYYRRGEKPRRASGYPFDVFITPKQVVISSQ